MKRLLKGFLLLVAAVLLMPAGYVAYRYVTFTPPPMDERPHRVGERMKFVIGKTAFDIAAVYYKGGAKDHLGRLSNVDLWALLPDFEWYDPQKNRYEFVERLGFGRRIQIHVDARESHMTTRKFVRKAKLVQGQGLGEEFGLEEFSGLSVREEQYIYWANDQPVIIMDCTRDGEAPSPSCSAWWDYSEDVVIQIAFSKEFLLKWKEIVEKTNDLLAGKPLVAVSKDSHGGERTGTDS